MNTFYSMILYMAIGGALCGIAIKDESERCGYPQKLATKDSVLFILTWPGLIAASMFRGEPPKSSPTCD